MPHLDAAFNLARWLTGNEHDAEDVVQDAFLRAFRFFEGFHGVNCRPWLLTIVRNAAYTFLLKHRKGERNEVFDEELHTPEDFLLEEHGRLFREAEQHLVRQAIAELPREFREVLVLRELEGMSYKDIAGITEAPIGTVMSRLARARKHLQHLLTNRLRKETSL